MHTISPGLPAGATDERIVSGEAMDTAFPGEVLVKPGGGFGGDVAVGIYPGQDVADVGDFDEAAVVWQRRRRGGSWDWVMGMIMSELAVDEEDLGGLVCWIWLSGGWRHRG